MDAAVGLLKLLLYSCVFQPSLPMPINLGRAPRAGGSHSLAATQALSL